MKKLVFLVFLLFVSFVYSQHLVQPDTLWTYGPANFTSYPAAHPNGNVLVRIDLDVHELNGLTGELIRKINIPVGNSGIGRIDVSQDGTKLLAGGHFIDYDTGELIRTLPNNYVSCFLHPFNDKIIYIKPRGYEHIDTDIIVHNLISDQTQSLNTVDFPTALAVSNDGRYLAIGCWDYETDRTHFSLYDAQTLKLIDELENVPSTGRRIDFIQFSETAKYVGYGHLSGGYYKSTFFTVLAPYNKWEFSEWKMPGYSMNGVGFINDRYAFLSNCSFDTIHSVIYNIDSGKIFNNINNYGSYLPLYNKENNTIILDQFYSQQNDQPIPILSCFDVKAGSKNSLF
jgi:hypothetical protein